MQQLLIMTCPIHREYTGFSEPTTRCHGCWNRYFLKELGEALPKPLNEYLDRHDDLEFDENNRLVMRYKDGTIVPKDL